MFHFRKSVSVCLECMQSSDGRVLEQSAKVDVSYSTYVHNIVGRICVIVEWCNCEEQNLNDSK